MVITKKMRDKLVEILRCQGCMLEHEEDVCGCADKLVRFVICKELQREDTFKMVGR